MTSFTELSSENSEIKPIYNFFNLEKDLLEIEDTCENKEKLSEILKQFLLLQLKIDKNGTFSKNEELDDIKSEDVKYLLLPYYVGKTFQLLKTDGMKQRRLHLLKVEANFESFISRCSEYRLLTKEQERLHDQKDVSIDPSTARNQRISGERDKLELKKKIDFLNYKKEKLREENDDLEELEREIYIEKVKMAIIDVLLGKKVREQEMQLLEFAAMREASGAEPFKPEAPKPLKVTRLTKDPSGNIHSQNIPIKPTVSQREQIYRDVFKPNTNGPTMSLEEYAEIEMKDLHERSKREREANEKRENENMLLENDDEDALDRKRQQDSAWDDWKDLNPKGQGNMKR